MTAKISDYKNILYCRDYSRDAPPQSDLFKRIALAAIPFLTLRRAFGLPVSLGMGTVRIWNTEERLQQLITIAALAGSIIRFQAGQIVSTIQDLFLEVKSLGEDPAKSLLKIVCHLAYLALLSRGGLEISLICFAMQTSLHLLNAKDEFKNDRWIEGCANLFMGAIRLHQTARQCRQLQRDWQIKIALKKITVGKLGKEWRFPSDHLPVGAEVNGVRIISWNVLNNAFMDWVAEKDSQGLNGSLITELHRPVAENGLTMRDVLVAEMIRTMTSQGQVVALQECSAPFLKHLKNQLPTDWRMVKSFEGDRKDQDVILYDKSRLAIQRSETSTSAYPSFPKRPLQNVLFRDKDRNLRIINAHIPGDPTLPGREEFANYVYRQQQQGTVTVALGDNNFERDEMIDAYRKAGFAEFSIHSPWKTNIDPITKESKSIDHLFVAGSDNSRDLRPEEVLSNGNLQETIDLLNP